MESSVPLLIAHDQGVDIVWTSTIPVLTGRPVDIAMPDLAGGVVLQGRDPDPARWPPTPVPIEWVSRPGGDPIVLIDGAGANRITPVQVIVAEGRRQLLYERTVVLDEDDQTTQLMLHDLEAGSERTLGIIGAYESSGTRIQVAAGRVALSWEPYGGEPGSCVGVIDLADLLDGDDATWIKSICGEGCCRPGPTEACGARPCSLRAALTPDATHLVVTSLTSSVSVEAPEMLAEIASIDLGSRGTSRFELALGADEWVDVLDAAIEYSVVGVRRADGSRRFGLLFYAETWSDVGEANWMTAWHDEPPLSLPWPRGDGLGPFEFGTPMEEVMRSLTALMGEPTDEYTDQEPWPEEIGPVAPCHTATGYPCDTFYRSVTWESSPSRGLSLVFTDGGEYGDPAVPHLEGWSYRGGGFPVPHLVGPAVGMSVEALVQWYDGSEQRSRDELHFGFDDHCGDPETASPVFWTASGLRGGLSGPPDDPDSVVTSLSAGTRSSC